MPHKWQYYHDIGFVYYWHLHDYQTAATWFQRAAAQPDAPNWLQPLAAVHARARERPRRGAFSLAADRQVGGAVAAAKRASARLLQLQALDQIDQLEAVVKRFPPAAGEPYTWD